MRLSSIDMEETQDSRFIRVATITDGNKKYVALGQVAPTGEGDEHSGKLRFEELRQSTHSGNYIATLHKIEDKEEWMAVVRFAATERIMRMQTPSGIIAYTSLMNWWENWCHRRGILNVDRLQIIGGEAHA